MTNQFGVYILQSLKNGRYYIGSTKDLKKRLTEHNQGLVKATKYITPLQLKVFIKCSDITIAKKAEYRLKKYKNRKILEKVIESSCFPWEYHAT